ncbi:hypothetical protein SEA_DIANE_49 [Streptomyces phage Diane]|uniref:Uncharacterized protein n=1 Tax=Streptomyces phage Diane TaxID=2041207 RepID=A0A291LIC9_9CAUD|nr:hypothetical protein KGG78_gp49 [Streptomyces phage Diane]ATI18833.1 hypothetical protein SEA_DIANE_49 [Streptomyces phage Diane]
MADETVHEDANGNVGTPRLLPWTHEGKDCWLTPASEGGVLSAMADAMEAEQMRDGREVLAQVRGLMEESDKLGAQELRFISSRLAESLADALRVAESRGIRLGIVDPTPDEDIEELVDKGLKGGE